jgi:ferrochelatase
VSSAKKRVGIVLFQLGGPDSLATVEPFLRNLFLDPDIIPLGPFDFVRGPLARYIAKKRTPPVAGRYAMIGRRSPIAILTERQRVRLVQAVSPYIDPVAVTAMRYWKMPSQRCGGRGGSMSWCCFLCIRIIRMPLR